MFNLFRNHQVMAIMSTRKHGSMKYYHAADKDEVQMRRRKFFQRNNIDENSFMEAALVHSFGVAIIDSLPEKRVIVGADALITKTPGVYLGFTVADCPPVFLFDPAQRAVGIVHCGWKNLALEIINSAISEMRDIGSSSENILAGVGPCIGPCHFKVGKDVPQRFSALVSSETVYHSRGKTTMDLKKIIKIQLKSAGLKPWNIEISPECTACDKEEFFSHRRDGKRGEDCSLGMLAVIGINA